MKKLFVVLLAMSSAVSVSRAMDIKPTFSCPKLFRFSLSTMWMPYYGPDSFLILAGLSKDSRENWINNHNNLLTLFDKNNKKLNFTYYIDEGIFYKQYIINDKEEYNHFIHRSRRTFSPLGDSRDTINSSSVITSRTIKTNSEVLALIDFDDTVSLYTTPIYDFLSSISYLLIKSPMHMELFNCGLKANKELCIDIDLNANTIKKEMVEEIIKHTDSHVHFTDLNTSSKIRNLKVPVLKIRSEKPCFWDIFNPTSIIELDYQISKDQYPGFSISYIDLEKCTHLKKMKLRNHKIVIHPLFDDTPLEIKNLCLEGDELQTFFQMIRSLPHEHKISKVWSIKTADNKIRILSKEKVHERVEKCMKWIQERSTEE